MAIEDLADQVDDYICTFEGLGDIVMDSLAMFVFIWSLCVLFLIWLGKFLYQKYVKKTQASTVTDTATPSSVKQAATTVSSVPIRKSEPRDMGAVRSGGGGGGGAGGGGFSKPIRADTPLGGPMAARKRITRRSPGPEIKQRNRHVQIPQNIMGQDGVRILVKFSIINQL